MRDQQSTESPSTLGPLPQHCYLDPRQFRLERDEAFFRSWQCVCHVSEIPKPGDFATLPIVDETIFVIRGEDGQVRGFYNVCRHRGHPLVEGFGHAGKRLVCPYHAWSYDYDGTLLRAPGASDQDSIACADISLREVRVEQLCGFVFVNLDDQAPALHAGFGDLEAELATYFADLRALRFVCETSIKHHCNWKISVENYNECYHCPTVHASSLTKGVLSLQGYTTRAHGKMIWHQGKAQTENEKQYDYDIDAGTRAGDYGAYWMWPNVSFCVYPGGFFTVRQWLAAGPRQTVYRYRWFSDGNNSDDAVRNLMQVHERTTGAEDEAVVAKVQKGVESRSFEPGPYILGDGVGASSEVGIRHFHELYRRAVGECPADESRATAGTPASTVR